MPRIGIRGGQSAGFGDEERQLDRAGASSLNRAYGDADEQHHEEVANFYNNLHSEVQIAREQRLMTLDRAKAERRIQFENRMAKAIPELYAIDPSAPDAAKQRAAFAAKYPDLFHGEKDIPSITQEFAQHVRIGQQSQEQRQRTEEARQAVADRERLQDKREQSISDRQDKSLDAREDRAKAASDAKESAAIAKARAAHGMASSKADELQSRMDKNREYYNIKDGKNDPDQAQKDKLDKSFDQLQKEHDAAAMTKSILETVHPEVLTPAEPVQNPNLTPPAANPAPANVSSTTPPANPNLTTPPPATEQDQAAPVGEDTVTPIAATAPPNLTPAQGASVGAPSVPPASIVGDSPVPPAAVAVPVSPEAQPTATPHPYEGKRVLQKSTGKYGTFTNGQFVPE